MTAEYRSPEWKARVSRGVRRYHALERVQLNPAHVARWRRRSEVTPAMRPYVNARTRQYGEIVMALGGPDELTPQRRALCDAWFQAQVTADALFGLVLAGGFVTRRDLIDKHTSYLAAARAALQALGLDRVAKDVIDLATYLEQAAENRAGATNGVDPGSPPEGVLVPTPGSDEGSP